MLKTKTVYKCLILIIIVLSLTGCWDQEELEDKSYVIGLGLDLSKHKGKIKVTMLLANPEVGSMQGGGGSKEDPREIISFDANDFIAAKATGNTIISRNISYELLSIIVVSEEFAKNNLFIPTIYDALKDKEIRLNGHLAVSKEKASEYFTKNQPEMETRPHKYFQFMVDHGIKNGLIPDSTLFRFFKTMERGTDLFLAMYTTAAGEKNEKIKREDEYMAGQVNVSGEFDNTQFMGSAVFKNGIMIGKLTGKETRVVNILDDTTEVKDNLLNIPDPFSKKTNSKQIATRITKTEKNKVRMNLTGKIPKIYITIPLRLEILTNPSMVNFTKKKYQRTLKKQIVSDIQKANETLFRKTQTQFKGAPYPLSFYARRYFGTTQEFKKFNWPKSFVKAEIFVQPEVTIIDYGKQTKRFIKVRD